MRNLGDGRAIAAITLTPRPPLPVRGRGSKPQLVSRIPDQSVKTQDREALRQREANRLANPLRSHPPIAFQLGRV